MPICPKCGKSLSSEQALSYHLNRKYKCGTWRCMECKRSFDTKLQLQLHEFRCGVEEKEYPDYGILRKMYDAVPVIMCEVDNGVIVRSNKNVLVGQESARVREFRFQNDSIIII